MKKLLPLCVALTACQAAGPEVLVVVGSDLQIPAELDAIYAGFSEDPALAPDGDRWERVPFADLLPASFVVRPGNGGPLGLYLEARAGDTPVLRHRVVADVPDTGTYLVPMFLAAACRTMSCGAEQTCSELGCVDPVVEEKRQVEAGRELDGLCSPGLAGCNTSRTSRIYCPVFGEPAVEEACNNGDTCNPQNGRCESNVPQYQVTVTRTGPGVGRITSEPEGLDCGQSCSLRVAAGSTVRLLAIAEQGSGFGAWRGACAGQGTPCTLVVNNNVQVEAEWITNSGPMLTVQLQGNGSGRVISGDSRIDCGTTCSAQYIQNTPVVLTAEPLSGSHFVSWTGPCSGSGNRCNVTVNGAMQVQASFQKDTSGAPGPYDLDGDGQSELIFSAPRKDGPNGTDAGRAYVIFGPAPNPQSGAELAPLHYDGPGANGRFGEAIAFSPDLTGDNQPDLVVSAPGFNNGKGGVIVIPGGTTLIRTLNGGFPTNAVIIDGVTNNSGFGATLVTDVDLNKDGRADLVVGAPGGGTVVGQVYVFFGSPTGLNVNSAASADVVLTAAEPNDHFGTAIAGAPDLNGDGADDLIVGAPEGGVPTPTGRVYVFFGGSGLVSRGAELADRNIGGFAGSRLGAAVAGLGDFNGDGRGDFAIGAPVRNTVYLFFNDQLGIADANSAQRVLNGQGFFGAALSGRHDYDGDGFPDLVVGSPEDGGPGYGRVAIFRGRQPGAIPDLVVNGNCAGSGTCQLEGFGSSLGPAGDQDGDGVVDLAVGSRFGGGSAGPLARGRITVHHFAPGASSEQWSEDAFLKVVGEPEAQASCATVLGGRSL
ncbi:MAG: FG-GAP repeat protein [Deltaproteobacteria bacterium]|nr:FG-GAP repeat protein [Deltaproteobacteria bacterium]